MKRKTKCGQAHAAKNVSQIFVVFSSFAATFSSNGLVYRFCSVAITLFYNTVTRQMMCCFTPSKPERRYTDIDNPKSMSDRSSFSCCLIHFMQSQHVTSSIYKLQEEEETKKKLGKKILHFKPSFSWSWCLGSTTPPSFSDMCVYVTANIMYSNCKIHVFQPSNETGSLTSLA